MPIIYTPRHNEHATAQMTYEDRPYFLEEVPARAEMILEAVSPLGLGPAQPPEDYGLAPILATHAADFVDFLRTTYQAHADFYGKAAPVLADTFARGARRRPRTAPHGPGYYGFGIGSPILAGTWLAAYWAAQCAVTAAEAVRAGAPMAYAVCRPPGHHAAWAMYGGFCYLNNAAIAARAFGGRVAVLDVDYHHGNGTQEIFYRDPNVLFCSLHGDPDYEYPFYWGGADERGEGPGQGLNHNWPLPPGTDDTAYLRALDEALEVIGAFAPDGLVVSLGLDIAAGDPLGQFQISLAGLRAIGRRIAGLGLPSVVVQEGGYKLDTLGASAAAVLQAWA